jgi:uncharacterized membrane protein YhfC
MKVLEKLLYINIDTSFLAHFLNSLLMVLLPIGLGIYLTRKLSLGWRLWWIGAATFILSQVGHIPFNYGVTALFQHGFLPKPPTSWALIFNSVVLGLSAGLWEEIARYAAYRWWAKDARWWGKGLLLGAGHGGVESIILSGIVLVTFINMVAVRYLDLSKLVPPEQLLASQQQISAYWNTPWYMSMIGALERCWAIIFHLAASLLVLQVFIRRQAGWLWLAVGWHAFLDAIAVYTTRLWPPFLVEAMIGLLALVSLWIIFSLRQPKPAVPEQITSSSTVESIKPLPNLEETTDNLERTRYE